MPTPLITAQELIDLLDEGRAPVLLDVRWRLGGPPGEEEHAAGHIPGAAYVDLDRDLSDPPGEQGRHPLPDPERFVAAMQRAGVGLEGPVVVYDDWAGHAAARAWWLLRHYGHRDTRLLDGGLAAWRALGGETEEGTVDPAPGDFHGVPGSMPVVEPDAVPGVDVLVDARAAERYRGEVEPLDPVAGHIPGAVNVPTTLNLDNHGHFRDPHELREVYADAGATGDGEVAAYCGSGVTACHDVLALSLVGVDAALYPGSWSEWVADSSRPVETG
jgi:thiosulfate/3-mercaptopyruvate sulfurtransferase